MPSAAVQRAMSPADRVTLLADSFPALRKAPGVAPWDEKKFVRWMKSGVSHGELCAARFVLSVWNHYDYKFDMHEAMGVWDNDNLAAFVAWAKAPWWA